jgi:hypothetical protein
MVICRLADNLGFLLPHLSDKGLIRQYSPPFLLATKGADRETG